LFRLIRRAGSSSSTLLPAVCGALAALTELTRKESQKLEGGDEVPRAVAVIRDDDIRCVLDTVRHNSGNLGVLLSIVRVLYNLLAHESTCTKFSNAGVEQCLADIMRAQPNELELHKMCVTALGVILGARSLSKAARGAAAGRDKSSGTVSVVLFSLHQFSEDSEQMLRALRVLAHTPVQASDVQEVSTIANTILKRHHASAPHVVAVCNVLVNFLQGTTLDPSDEDLDTATMHESMRLLTTTLQNQPPSEGKEINVAICKCLAVCSGHWVLPADDLVPAILTQFENQPQHAELLVSSCQILKNVAMKDPDAVEKISARNGFDIIFNGTQAHKDNVELLKLALDVLSLLRSAPAKEEAKEPGAEEADETKEEDAAVVEPRRRSLPPPSREGGRPLSRDMREGQSGGVARGRKLSAGSSDETRPGSRASVAEGGLPRTPAGASRKAPGTPKAAPHAALAAERELRAALPPAPHYVPHAEAGRSPAKREIEFPGIGDEYLDEELGGAVDEGEEEEERTRRNLIASATSSVQESVAAEALGEATITKRGKASGGIDIPCDAAMPVSVPAAPEHIDTMPSEAEPFYKRPKNLASQMIMHDLERLANKKGRRYHVVYDCFEPRLVEPPGPSASGKAVNVLQFESRYESGNLRRAVYVGDNEYDLMLKVDINTKGNTQWFYFSVTKMQPGVAYKFNIINLLKPDSQYNYGMQPLIYSDRNAADKGVGWVRSGTEICYYQNHHNRGKKEGNYYTLTCTLTFPHQHDTVHLAYGYPYTYTRLLRYLKTTEDDPQNAHRFRRRVLCHTLGGYNCDIVTITSFDSDPEEIKKRRGIFLTARVHPGETNASWMMQGVLEYLLGPTHTAKVLRDNFVFKIVPMLNPDGVIHGNYRCSLAGVDLNRRWLRPSKKLNPTIYYTKHTLKKFQEGRQVLIFCDMHGHSRKKNVFMYGCEQRASEYRLHERILPRLLWENALVFSYDDCSFSVTKSKDTTARVVVARELNITNSYTLEASFCGANFGRYNSCHFSTMHFEQVGRSFCETIFDFCDPNQTRARAALTELKTLYPVAKEDEDADSDWEEDGVGGKKDKKKKKKEKEGKEKKDDKASKAKTGIRRPPGSTGKKGDTAPPMFGDPRLSGGGGGGDTSKRSRGPTSSREKAGASATSRPAGFGSLAAVGSVGRVSGVRSKIKIVPPVPPSRRHD